MAPRIRTNVMVLYKILYYLTNVWKLLNYFTGLDVPRDKKRFFVTALTLSLLTRLLIAFLFFCMNTFLSPSHALLESESETIPPLIYLALRSSYESVLAAQKAKQL